MGGAIAWAAVVLLTCAAREIRPNQMAYIDLYVYTFIFTLVSIRIKKGHELLKYYVTLRPKNIK